MVFDVIVAGGSFAGLSFARHASLNGLKVLVIDDNKEIGSNMGTTGILDLPLLKELKIPKNLIANKIKKMEIYSPKEEKVEIDFGSPKFFMSYTGEFLKWLAESCIENDVTIKTGRIFTGFKKDVVQMKLNNRTELFETKYIVGADGAHSSVAKAFDFDKNHNFMVGLEKVYDKVNGVEEDKFYCFFDYESAPGYLKWVAPRGEQVFVGLMGYPDKFDINKSFDAFKKKMDNFFDFTDSKMVQIKSGFVPINGPLDNIVSDKALLLGDSAGQCWALRAEGIYPAIKYSKIAAKAVSNHILNKDENDLEKYKELSKNDADARVELILRKIYDKFSSNKLLNDFFGLLKEDPKMIEVFISKHHELLLEEIIEVLRHPNLYPFVGKILLDELKILI